MVDPNIPLAFSSNNARNEEDDAILNWFVDNRVFWSVFSDTHNIIYGTRGSGKTFLSRMASFQLLSKSPLSNAKKIVKDLEYIGIFVNTDLRFVGATRSPIWNTDKYREVHFIWKFNLNCVKALCVTLQALLPHVVAEEAERLRIELAITKLVAGLVNDEQSYRLSEIDQFLSEYEARKRRAFNDAHLNGEEKGVHLSDGLSSGIFEPIFSIIDFIEIRFTKIRTARWLFFVDEAEFLTVDQLRILNSFMRTHSRRVFLKIATLPYHYGTLQTNLSVPLQENDDYQVISIDESPTYTLNRDSSTVMYEFAKKIYSSRLRSYVARHRIPVNDSDFKLLCQLDKVLFHSRLLANKPEPVDSTALRERLQAHLSDKTVARSVELLENGEGFGSEVWRKVSGVMDLREQVASRRTGQSSMDLYSGLEIVVRSSDGVPRKLINLFRDLVEEAVRSFAKRRRAPGGALVHTGARSIVPYRNQNRILTTYGRNRLSSSLAVAGEGPRLHKLIDILGNHFRSRLHREKVSTDLIASFSIDSSCSEELWRIVKAGVAYGHIVPNASSSRPQRIDEERTFHLSYAYAALFHLYPTQGKSRALSTIVADGAFASNETSDDDRQFKLFGGECE